MALETPASVASKNLVPGLLMAATGAIAFSGKAIIVKFAYRYGVDAVTLIMYRMLFALPIFVAMAWWAGRGKPPIARSDRFGIGALGVSGYYLASFLDFAGLQYISASLERLILYLNPTLVMLLGWALYRKRFTWRQVTGMAVSYGGVLLVFARESSVSDHPDTALGAVLVVGSALSYAVYLVYSGQVVQRIGSLRLVGLATTVACLCCIGQFLLLRPLSAAADVASEVVWLSLLNATVCTALPVLLVMMGIERVGATVAAQTGMVGPMTTLLLGVVLLGEPFTPGIAAGTLCVLTGIFIFTRSPGRPGQPAHNRALPQNHLRKTDDGPRNC